MQRYDHDTDGGTTGEIIRPEVKTAINTFLRGKRITVTFYNADVEVFVQASTENENPNTGPLNVLDRIGHLLP